MHAFDHVMLLVSFVFALALTHLLSRIAALFLVRERVRFSGLLALAMLNAIALLFTNWLALWDLRGARQWDILSITTMFAFSLSIYFLCAAAAPEAAADGPVDMDAFYWRNYRPYYVIFLICMLLAMASNFIFLQTPNAKLFIEENVSTLPFFLPAGLALSVRANWAQWLAGASFFCLTVWFTLAFLGTLH